MARPVDKANPLIPACLQVVIQWVAGTKTWSNVLHGGYTAAGDPTQTLVDSLFTGFKSAFTTSGWGALVHTDVAMTGIKCKDLRAFNRPYVLSTTAAANGTSSGQILPISNAVAVTLATAQSGKGFSGRVYLTGFDEASIQDHLHHTAAAGTAAAAFINAIAATMNSNSVPMVVAQRALLAGTTEAGTPMGPRPANTLPVIQGRIVNVRIDSQRRRLGK